ncbi:26S proteasome non-ATPase regulatory subunit 4 homolog [Rutidosis leptorrhynchoides]|uniref:26S proteasome non-ATPase regulatory subunit 4 homolog n=1 Tax=Rutidosis leptorrhynchoides TaxID=125765 RepID=UPI003A991DBA
MITMMRRSLGKVSHHPAAIAIGIGKGRGCGTVSQSEENNNNKLMKKKKKTQQIFNPPKKAPSIDDQSGNREKITTILPPSSPLLSSVASSGAAGGGGNQPVQPTTPTVVGKEEEVNKPEAVIICIDNSVFMKYIEPYRYRLQIRCIRSYCRDKLESNPKNSIGILTMSSFEVRNNLFPTSDLDKVLHNLKYQLNVGGPLDFKQGIKDAWWHLPSDEQSTLRAIFFIGGAINLNSTKAKAAGRRLKQYGVAVDVVNFWRRGRYTLTKKALDAFVAAANNENNSTIHHVQVEPSTRSKDVLLRVFKLDEGEIVRKKKAKDREKERARKQALKRMLQSHRDKLVKEMAMGNGRW